MTTKCYYLFFLLCPLLVGSQDTSVGTYVPSQDMGANSSTTELLQVDREAQGQASQAVIRNLCREVGLNPDHGLGELEYRRTYTQDEVSHLAIFRHLLDVQGASTGQRPPVMEPSTTGRYSAQEVAGRIVALGGSNAVQRWRDHAEQAHHRRQAQADAEQAEHQRHIHDMERLGKIIGVFTSPLMMTGVGALLISVIVTVGLTYYGLRWYFTDPRPLTVSFTTLVPWYKRRPALPAVQKLFFNPATRKDLKAIARLDRAVIKGGGHEFTGLILEGPPGTGKTSFARQLAVQAGFELIECDGQRLGQLPLHRALQELYELHALITKYARRGYNILVFIDECDGIFKRRGQGDLHAEKLCSAFLALVNEPTQLGVKWVLTTNRSQTLDEAILDRHEVVHVGLPEEATALACFAHYKQAYDGQTNAYLGNLNPSADNLAGLSQRTIKQVVRQLARKYRYLPPHVSVQQLNEELANALSSAKTNQGRQKMKQRNTYTFFKFYTY